MPIYEYRCQACGHTLDALQKVGDLPLSDCPSCSESALKRLISAPAFRLKGKGWYETDFKSDKERKRNLAESVAGDAGEKSKDEKKATASDDKKATKSDDKPKAKSEKKPGKGSGSEAA
jgi:putative FmdB family regulatory protein